MGRSAYTEALVGPKVYTKIKETPILVVGAGGIGCELRESARAGQGQYCSLAWSPADCVCSEEPRSRRLRQHRNRQPWRWAGKRLLRADTT